MRSLLATGHMDWVRRIVVGQMGEKSFEEVPEGDPSGAEVELILLLVRKDLVEDQRAAAAGWGTAMRRCSVGFRGGKTALADQSLAYRSMPEC